MTRTTQSVVPIPDNCSVLETTVDTEINTHHLLVGATFRFRDANETVTNAGMRSGRRPPTSS